MQLLLFPQGMSYDKAVIGVVPKKIIVRSWFFARLNREKVL